MKFKPATEGHAKMMGAWFSDNNQYKVVKYGKNWSAYFKPDGWCNFGNSCRKTFAGSCVGYETRQEAQADCEHHLERYGIEPGATDRLPLITTGAHTK